MKYLIIAIAFTLISCSNETMAEKALRDRGYTNVKITESLHSSHAFFGCGEYDSFHTGFEANSINGTRVKGVVCSGMPHKGATIRITD